MKRIAYIVMAAIVLIAVACSSPSEVSITGEIEGAGSADVVVTYFARGGVQRKSVTANDGRFTVNFESSTSTLAMVTLDDGRLIVPLVVSNGDKIDLKANADDPSKLKVTGSEQSEMIARWVADNSALLRQSNDSPVNRAVADFVGKNRDRLAATAVLVTYFRAPGNEVMADSLFSLLSGSARSTEVVQGFNSVVSAQLVSSARGVVPYMTLYERCDSTINFNPGGHAVNLLCFVTDDRSQRAEASGLLRRLTDSLDEKRFYGLELSAAPDSAAWMESLEIKAPGWDQVWLMSSVGAPAVRDLAIPRLPYFIVADSTGHQTYRGQSASLAEAEVMKIYHAK